MRPPGAASRQKCRQTRQHRPSGPEVGTAWYTLRSPSVLNEPPRPTSMCRATERGSGGHAANVIVLLAMLFVVGRLWSARLAVVTAGFAVGARHHHADAPASTAPSRRDGRRPSPAAPCAFTIDADTGYHVADVVVDGTTVGAVLELHLRQRHRPTTTDRPPLRPRHLHDHGHRRRQRLHHAGDRPDGDYGGIADRSPSTRTPATTSPTWWWTASRSGAVASYTFSNVTADHTISATFAIDTFTITPTAGANGTISPATRPDRQLRRQPDLHHRRRTPATTSPTCRSTACTGRARCTSYTFTNVTGNHTISATFAIDTFTITPTAGANGTISPGGAQTVDYGGSRTFTITPDAGYHVADVLVDGDSVGAVTELHLHQRHRRTTRSAPRSRSTPSRSRPRPGANGSISPATAQTVDYGGSQAFTITPADRLPRRRRARRRRLGRRRSRATRSRNVTADHTISATFAIDTFTITPTAGPNGSICPATPQTVDYGDEPGLHHHPGHRLPRRRRARRRRLGRPGHELHVHQRHRRPHDQRHVRHRHVHDHADGRAQRLHQPGHAADGRLRRRQTFTITPGAGYYVADVLVDGVSVGPVTSYTFLDVGRGPHDQRHLRGRLRDGAGIQIGELRRHLRWLHPGARGALR